MIKPAGGDHLLDDAKERRKPDILKASRKKRIAAGSGTSVEEVNKLLKMHRQMADMMKALGGKKGMKGLGALFGEGGMPSPDQIGGMAPPADSSGLPGSAPAACRRPSAGLGGPGVPGPARPAEGLGQEEVTLFENPTVRSHNEGRAECL